MSRALEILAPAGNREMSAASTDTVSVVLKAERISSSWNSS